MNEVSPPMEGTPLISPSSTEHPLYNSIVDACRTVFDPEIPVNIYDLGLIYTIEITEDNDVNIIMSLTAPGCPVAGEMPAQVAEAVAALTGAGRIAVTLVWEPAWTPERMSEDAKLALDYGF